MADITPAERAELLNQLETPDGWEWSGGNGSDNYYTHVFTHPGREFELRLYWDGEPGDNQHTVVLYPYTTAENGDHLTGYACHNAYYDDMADAVQDAEDTMKQVTEGDYSDVSHPAP